MRFSRFKTPKGKLWKMGGISCLIHGSLIALFSLTPWDKVIEAQPPVYTVTLTSIVLPPPEPVAPPLRAEPRVEKAKPVEKKSPPPPPKTREPQKEVVEKAKPPKEKPLPKKPSLRNLPLEPDEATEAIKKIQMKLARREEPKKPEEPPPVVRPLPPPLPPLPPLPPAKPPPPPSSTPPPTVSNPSPPSAARLASLWDRYYSMVWAKVKDEWKIPKDVEKEMVDLETVIIVVIGRGGKIKECWIEKPSGHPQYDELAMRAVRRAEPLPDPREVSAESIDLGLRFTSGDYAKY
jgi:TonB family protein